MPEPITIAVTVYKFRKPIAITAGLSAVSILILPVMMIGGGASADPPQAPVDPCMQSAPTGPPSSTASPAQPVSEPTSTASASTFPLPPPGKPRKDSLNRPAESIPTSWKKAYDGASARFGVPWTLLAGIGEEETQQGRNVGVSVAGAKGPMQFTDATWQDFGIDGNGDGAADVMNPADAIYSAANMLVKSGVKNGTAGVRKAIMRYNAASWYVNDVLWYAKQYGGGNVVNDCEASASGPYGRAAVAAAQHWLGLPYIWGAGTVGPPPGPTGPMGGKGGLTRAGFDCSGLTAAVVAVATRGKLRLPHYSTSQYTTTDMATVARYSGHGAPPLSKLRPGDVLLFNIPLSLGYDSHPWNHAGIYIGNGKMIHAPHPGSVVRVDSIATGWPYEWVGRRPLAKYTGGDKNPSPSPTTSPCITFTCEARKP